MHVPLSTQFDADSQLTVADFSSLVNALPSPPCTDDLRSDLQQVFGHSKLCTFLVRASRADVFSSDTAEQFSSERQHVPLLRQYKMLKYSMNLPLGQLLIALTAVVKLLCKSATIIEEYEDLTRRVVHDDIGQLRLKRLVLDEDAQASTKEVYAQNAVYLEDNDPHAIFPTSVYRQCSGHVTSTEDSTVIEGVMGTTITTTIEIVRDVLNPEKSHQLRDVYSPLSRCVTVIDERVDGIYGKDIENYFAFHSIPLTKLSYRCMEVDKDITTVEKILVDLKGLRVSRNEPVLIVGGGVMADIGGFACALYHRNTPYVMLCTSIVSGIDAGPSPRTCSDGLGYKNVFGAYHPPILTLTDRQLWKSLHPGWIRHGIAEIIKMAATKDTTLLDDVEEAGARLVDTKFGTEGLDESKPEDAAFAALCDRITAKAMDGYVRAEYGNLWETHQCRPHAFGHTWSPGFELQAGLLHGHAISIGMGYGSYLAYKEGWITNEEFHRVLKVFSVLGLSLRHDILNNVNSIWSAQCKMVEKRGGNLCAPVPKHELGKCGYINDVSREYLTDTLREYQEIVAEYPNGGIGIDAHCHDVGLEDPSTVKQHADNAVAADAPQDTVGGTAPAPATPTPSGASNIDTYNAWIASEQEKRNAGKSTASAQAAEQVRAAPSADTPTPPSFAHSTLFHDGADEYAADMTSLCGADFGAVADATESAGLFAPCMVGKVEGQFLRMMTQIKGAKSVLDIGTFTGYSALAFASGGAEVTTLEADKKTAQVARELFEKSEYADKIHLVECDAKGYVEELKEEKFDIVFLDADKVNYKHYYEAALKCVKKDGIIMADNALCSLVYDDADPAKQKLHEFAQYVRADKRVEQVMLTVREGILIVRKV